MVKAMPIGDPSPGRYKPNPTDYRNVDDEHVEDYVSVSRAIEEVEELLKIVPGPESLHLNPKIRQALRTAESALRRSAWMLVAYYGKELPHSPPTDPEGEGTAPGRGDDAVPADHSPVSSG